MSTRASDRFDEVVAQLARDFRQLALLELAQVGWRVDARKARVALGVDHRVGIWKRRLFSATRTLGARIRCDAVTRPSDAAGKDAEETLWRVARDGDHAADG